MSLVSSRSRPPQSPENRDVTEEHECERYQDHDGENPVEVGNVSHTLGCGVNQSEEPDAGDADGAMPLVLELDEGDGMQHGHISVQTDAGQKERRRVFDAVEEAQDVPGAAGAQVDYVGQLQRRNEAEERVQHGQVHDEDVWAGRVALVFANEPQNHDVGRDAQEHINELQHQVEDEHGRHVCAAAVDRLLSRGV